MGRARPRYIAQDRFNLNDTGIAGQELALVGMCDQWGNTKTSKGKKMPKKYLTHYTLKFQDKKWLRENKIPQFLTIHVSKWSLETFFRLKDK